MGKVILGIFTVVYAFELIQLLVGLFTGGYSFIGTAGMFGLILPHFYFVVRLWRFSTGKMNWGRLWFTES